MCRYFYRPRAYTPTHTPRNSYVHTAKRVSNTVCPVATLEQTSNTFEPKGESEDESCVLLWQNRMEENENLFQKIATDSISRASNCRLMQTQTKLSLCVIGVQRGRNSKFDERMRESWKIENRGRENKSIRE